MNAVSCEWSSYIANRIIEPIQGSDRLALKLMRAKVADTIDEFYDTLRKEPEKELIDVDTLANFIARQIRTTTKGSIWEQPIHHPLVKMSLHHELSRSIKAIINP